MTVEVGSRIGFYEVLARLGAGGMGDVYRARDPRLGREVAIKLLPRELTSDPELIGRFAQEARAASALSHPNIVTIYDIGEHEGAPYLAMELVGGHTLRTLVREGPLSLARVVHIGAQIADGLAAAHERGIVHRDVKPENTMVTADGLVKLLDFGLAKLLDLEQPSEQARDPDADALTRPGALVGTAGYMSPEQVRGRPADARSDLFALGCVLFEMATGRRPFQGETPFETLALILREEPDFGADLGRVPPELERVIGRCLAKEPARRYPLARAVAVELRALTSAPPSGSAWQPSGGALAAEPRRTPRPTATTDSVAVLPLANVDGDPGAEYLVDGISEQIINCLAGIPALRVIPRGTVFRYKNRDVDGLDAGRELGARLVLSGRVRQRGDELNVQAELVDVLAGTQVWGEQYLRPMADLHAVQREIAGVIADRLRVRLTGEQRQAVERVHTDDPEAYRLYLKGRYFWNKRTAEGLNRAVALLREAIERDPTYALAWAGLADAYNNLGTYCVVPATEAFPRAKAAARQALELDPDRAEPHASLAFAAQYFDWDWGTAEREYRLGIERNPAYPTVHHWYGWMLICQGRFAEAERAMRRALELDPLSLPITTNLGFCHFFARRYPAAVEQFSRALEMDPDFAEAHRGLGEASEHQGDFEVAVVHYQRALTASGGSSEVVAARGRALGRAGRRDEALAAKAELERLDSGRYVSAYEHAAVEIGLGRLDAAVERLWQGLDERPYKLVYLKVDPALDPLRGLPRFVDLLGRVGLGV
jgi:eukaryotic-like serine/threonine-protein kinase